jgi:hypothetical protein
MYSASPRQQLLEAIAKLSDPQLQIVLQFIQTLQPKPIPNLPDTPIDPLANFIGATTHGNLAQAIDETLDDYTVFID